MRRDRITHGLKQTGSHVICYRIMLQLREPNSTIVSIWMDGVNVMVRARYRVSRMVELMLCTCVAITQSCSEETVGRLLVVTSIGG